MIPHFTIIFELILKNQIERVIILSKKFIICGGIIVKAVVSVVGKDTVGILATISNECAKYGANIIDVSQTIVNEYFTMFMIINIQNISVDFIELVDILTKLGTDKNLKFLF